MKVVNGHDVLNMVLNGENIDNLWFGDPKDIKGSGKNGKQGGIYFTMLPLKGHLKVDEILNTELLIVDLS